MVAERIFENNHLPLGRLEALNKKEWGLFVFQLGLPNLFHDRAITAHQLRWVTTIEQRNITSRSRTNRLRLTTTDHGLKLQIFWGDTLNKAELSTVACTVFRQTVWYFLTQKGEDSWRYYSKNFTYNRKGEVSKISLTILRRNPKM